MADLSQVFQHFHPEEKMFVEQTLDKIDRIVSQYGVELTPFLNPRESFIVTSLSRRAGLQVFSSGDYYPTESVRLLLAPDYYLLQEDDFELTLLELQYARKFNQLTHSQILGNLVNQLGIKRQLLGDIMIGSDSTQILVDRKISEYLVQHITKISRVPVKWQMLDLDKLISPQEDSKSVTLSLIHI